MKAWREKGLLFDGAFGTYYAQKHGSREICEWANVHYPQRVKAIHQEYIDAGAQAIKTNTFSIARIYQESQGDEWKQLVYEAVRLAKEAVADRDVMIFADLGPLDDLDESSHIIYQEICDVFLETGVSCFLFETLASVQGICETVSMLRAKLPEAVIMMSFAVNTDGYTRMGISLKSILAKLSSCDVDIVGLNCINGPVHMKKLLPYFEDQKIVSIMPNAGYPGVMNARSVFNQNVAYYAQECASFLQYGVKVLGGCCGTTPKHIQALKEACEKLDGNQSTAQSVNHAGLSQDDNPIRQKLNQNQRIIAVEFDPPQDCRIDTFMRNAEILREEGVDLITIADCPIARARMDSSLLACKLHRELGLDVMPHMTCRDRNLNAAKALLFGLEVEGIRNVLIVTGDPIPADNRSEIKGVFNFNSAVLSGYIRDLNETMMPHPFMIFAALNVNAVNFDAELQKAQRKIDHGVQGFLTQPVHSEMALRNLARAHQELDAYILGGIMPIVSHRNALFMHNEISGMHIDERIIDCYEGTDRAQAAQLAVSISCAIADQMQEYVDGYYLITPFNRVEIITEIMKHLKQ